MIIASGYDNASIIIQQKISMASCMRPAKTSLVQSRFPISKALRYIHRLESEEASASVVYDGISITIKNGFLFNVSSINIAFRHTCHPFHRKCNGKTPVPKAWVVVGDIIKTVVGHQIVIAE